MPIETLLRVLAARPDHATVFVGDDGFDARELKRLGDVDAADARVRVRAAEDARVKHPGQMNVAGIGGRAGDALDGVDAGRGVADGF